MELPGPWVESANGGIEHAVKPEPPAPVDVRADGVECPFPVWTEYVFKGVYHILAELAREETGHLRVERNEGERRVRK